MVSLRDHLRADEDAGLTRLHGIDDARKICGGGGGVAIQAGERLIRKQLAQSLLDSFGALAHRFDPKAAAWAGLGQRSAVAAVMTAQDSLTAMDRQARVAIRAGSDPSARGAQQRRRVAATVDEHDDLAAGREMS